MRVEKKELYLQDKEKLSTREIGQQNETTVLLLLAKFAWLTRHQIAYAIYGERSNALKLTGRILKRMSERHFIESFEIDHVRKKSVAGWTLTLTGKRHLLSISPNVKVYGYKSLERAINQEPVDDDDRNFYHRYVCNSFVLQLTSGKYENLGRVIVEGSRTFSECELSYRRVGFFESMGTLPDAMLLNGDIAVSIEVENASRGPIHSEKAYSGDLKKFYVFLDAYLDRLHKNGCCSYELDQTPVGPVEEMMIVFVCNSHATFRNIHTQVQKRIDHYSASLLDHEGNEIHKGYRFSEYELDGRFYYYVADNHKRTKNWVNPLKDLQIFEHTENEASDLIERGRDRNKYTKAERAKIIEIKGTGQFTMAELSQQYGVDRSTIYRWIKKHRVW
jgi:hypothetical protein